MHTHIELLDRFMSGKTSPEEERTLLAWFRDPDHKEEIMAFYKSRWEESSGKKLPPKLQGQMFCEIKKRMRVRFLISLVIYYLLITRQMLLMPVFGVRMNWPSLASRWRRSWYC